MTLARSVVLQSPIYDAAHLNGLVDRCIADSVELIAIAGRNAHTLEAEIDWKIIGDGTVSEKMLYVW